MQLQVTAEDDAGGWIVNCTAEVYVDLSCPLCSPLVAATERHLSTTHLVLIVCFTAVGLLSLLIGVAVFGRRIRTTHKSTCRYDALRTYMYMAAQKL